MLNSKLWKTAAHYEAISKGVIKPPVGKSTYGVFMVAPNLRKTVVESFAEKLREDAKDPEKVEIYRLGSQDEPHSRIGGQYNLASWLKQKKVPEITSAKMGAFVPGYEMFKPYSGDRHVWTRLNNYVFENQLTPVAAVMQVLDDRVNDIRLGKERIGMTLDEYVTRLKSYSSMVGRL